jgi:hypothetical protein
VVIEVRRAGTLAQLGHDHVVVSHDVAGYVAPAANRADLYVPLDRMVVDERQARAEAHFDGQPPEDAIEGTRGNMLGKLDAATYPFAVLGVRGIEKDATGGSSLNATLALKGVAREIRIPAQVASMPDEISVSGSVTVAQTSFGIVPYSVLAGALQVRDEVDIRFSIRRAGCRCDGARPLDLPRGGRGRARDGACCVGAAPDSRGSNSGTGRRE